MILFDPYVLETWSENGLIVAVPVHQDKKKERPVPATKFRSVVTASVLAIGMALTSLSFVPGEVAIGGLVKSDTNGNRAGRGVDEEVAPGYWPKLVALVRNAPSLPDEDTANDPAPLV